MNIFPGNNGGAPASVDVRAKIICASIFILATVATPVFSLTAFAAYLFFILAWAALAKAPFKKVLYSGLAVLPFALIGAFSAPFMGHSSGEQYHLPLGIDVSTVYAQTLLGASVKSFLCAACVALLFLSDSFEKVMEGLERLRVPKPLTNVAAFAYRQIFIIADEVHRMKRARELRLYGGKWVWHSVSAGGIAGSLFVRSFERGERIYAAMLSRGYSGSFVSATAVPFSFADYAAVAFTIAYLFAARAIG